MRSSHCPLCRFEKKKSCLFVCFFIKLLMTSHHIFLPHIKRHGVLAVTASLFPPCYHVHYYRSQALFLSAHETELWVTAQSRQLLFNSSNMSRDATLHTQHKEGGKGYINHWQKQTSLKHHSGYKLPGQNVDSYLISFECIPAWNIIQMQIHFDNFIPMTYRMDKRGNNSFVTHY